MLLFQKLLFNLKNSILIAKFFYVGCNTNMILMYNYSVHIQGHKIYTLHHLKTFVQPTWEDQYPLQVAYCNGTINNESYFLCIHDRILCKRSTTKKFIELCLSLCIYPLHDYLYFVCIITNSRTVALWFYFE